MNDLSLRPEADLWTYLCECHPPRLLWHVPGVQPGRILQLGPPWSDFSTPIWWCFSASASRSVRWLEIGRLNVTNSDKTVDRLTNSSHMLRDVRSSTEQKCLVLLCITVAIFKTALDLWWNITPLSAAPSLGPTWRCFVAPAVATRDLLKVQLYGQS